MSLYRSTQVKATLLGDECVDNLFESISHDVLDVNFLWLISGECRSEKSDNSCISICFPFFSITTISESHLLEHTDTPPVDDDFPCIGTRVRCSSPMISAAHVPAQTHGTAPNQSPIQP